MMQQREYIGTEIANPKSTRLPFAFTEAKQIYLKNLNKCKEELETLVLEIVNKEEAEEVLNRTIVQGSPYKNQLLTPEILKKSKLQPKYRMSIHGIERALFSPAYNIGQGRIAVAAYIKKEKKYIAASYYLSNSHGIWRCLDGYFMVENKIISYGKIVYEAFLSGNGQFIYTFCRDEKNRRWLASIENHSKIQPTGVRRIWVDGGDLTTPAYEYDIKAGVYGNTQLRWGNYIDMSKNYLSKIWKTAN